MESKESEIFVGRESELEDLVNFIGEDKYTRVIVIDDLQWIDQTSLDALYSLIRNSEETRIINGPFGIGKTTLLNHVKTNSEMYSVRCDPEGTFPLGAFYDILKPLNQEHLISTKPPQVINTALFKNDGRLLGSINEVENMDMIVSLLTGVGDFAEDMAKQVLDEKGKLHEFRIGETNIYIEYGKNYNLVSWVKGVKDVSLDSTLITSLKNIEDLEELENWDGDMTDMEKILDPYFSRFNKYTGKQESAVDPRTALGYAKKRIIKVLTENGKYELKVLLSRRTKEGSEQDPKIDKMIGELKKEEIGIGQVTLSDLESFEIKKIIAQRYSLENEDYPQFNKFCERITREGSGNPFYVIQILSSLETQGEIDPENPKFDIDLKKLEIPPEGIEKLIEYKISKLDETEGVAAKWISIAGQLQMDTLSMLIGEVKAKAALEGLDSIGILRYHADGEHSIDSMSKKIILRKLSEYDIAESSNTLIQVIEHKYKDELEENEKIRTTLARLWKDAVNHPAAFYDARVKAYELNIEAAERAYRLFDQEDTIFHAKTALDISRDKLEDKEREFEALKQIQRVEIDTGLYDQAVETNKDLIRLSIELKDKILEGEARSDRGGVLLKSKNFEEAKEFLYDAKELLKEEKYLTARNNRFLGQYHWLINESGGKGDREDAAQGLDFFLQSIDSLEGSTDEKWLVELGASYMDHGNLLRYLKEHGRALEYMEKGIQIMTEINDRWRMGKTYNNLAWNYHEIGNNKRGLELVNQAIYVAQSIDNRSDEAEALDTKGYILKALRRKSEAEECFEARDILRGKE